MTPWAETDFRVVIGSTGIAYDPNKEEINRTKHGYSLESAVHLLQRLVFPVPSPLFMTTEPFEENGEVRHNHMTLDDGHVLFFVTTMRPGETVRVISLRRASDTEKELYLANAKALGYIP
ncbi:MAG: BrnT family toxin [Burkholderiales bacterium]|nr:BrnT family toxin [Burkholderiales bacterium]